MTKRVCGARKRIDPTAGAAPKEPVMSHMLAVLDPFCSRGCDLTELTHCLYRHGVGKKHNFMRASM
jgi:hypothetical protein